MKEKYIKLYNDYTALEKNGRRIECINETCHFVTMKGTKYDAQDIKLMIIGRAPNGWDSLPVDSAEAFGDKAEEKYKSTAGCS